VSRIVLSLFLAGLASFGLLGLFFLLVPRVVGERASAASSLLQYVLILALVVPAIAAAIFGPGLFFELTANDAATKDQRTWLIVGGIASLCVTCVAALRSPAGRRYSAWRARVE
jgi:hypothetical protein